MLTGLKNHVALVTGGASGIGLTLTKTLAQPIPGRVWQNQMMPQI